MALWLSSVSHIVGVGRRRRRRRREDGTTAQLILENSYHGKILWLYGFVALWLCCFMIYTLKCCGSRKSEILMFSQNLRRKDFVKYGVAYYSTTAQLILENSYRGHFVATTTLSFVQTIQQPHFHAQMNEIIHIKMCFQFKHSKCYTL